MIISRFCDSNFTHGSTITLFSFLDYLDVCSLGPVFLFSLLERGLAHVLCRRVKLALALYLAQFFFIIPVLNSPLLLMHLLSTLRLHI